VSTQPSSGVGVSGGSSGGPHPSPLDSPAIGTATNDLIQPCRTRDPRPAEPSPPDVLPAFSMAFSGGGFRATLAALGVVRFMAGAGLLGRVRYVSSVSGGSVAHGLLACDYAELAGAGFAQDRVDTHLITPFVRAISSRSLSSELIRGIWRAIGTPTRTDLLADAFDRWFYEGRLLEDLPPGCRFIFNAASVTTGVRFGFERDVLGDWVIGRAPTAGTGLRVAQAAAASAAVPGAFAPFEVRHVSFPCAGGVAPKLLDGGAYDNMGLEPLDDMADVCVVAVNAGGVFRTGRYGGVPIIRDLQRANGLLYRQSTALRMRTMVERFKAWEEARAKGEPPPPWGRLGVLFGLATTLDATEEWTDGRPEHPEWRIELARVPTVFSRLSADLCNRMIYRTWWLTGAVLSRYHRSLLPAELPRWSDLP
jgi:NTE family protein